MAEVVQVGVIGVVVPDELGELPGHAVLLVPEVVLAGVVLDGVLVVVETG